MQIGNDEATVIITEVKDTIIGENIVNAEQIEQVIIDKSTQYDISLTDEQVSMILGTMEKIAGLEYDYEAIKSTLSKIGESAAEKLGFTTDTDTEEADGQAAEEVQKVKNFFKGIGEWFKNLFSNQNVAEENGTDETEEDATESSDLGILENTNDALLGEGAIIDATDESVITQPETDTDSENNEAAEEGESTGSTLDDVIISETTDSFNGQEGEAENADTEDGTVEGNVDAESEDSQNGTVTDEATDSQNSTNQENSTEGQTSGIVVQQESSDSYQTEELTGNAQ